MLPAPLFDYKTDPICLFRTVAECRTTAPIDSMERRTQTDRSIDRPHRSGSTTAISSQQQKLPIMMGNVNSPSHQDGMHAQRHESVPPNSRQEVSSLPQSCSNLLVLWCHQIQCYFQYKDQTDTKSSINSRMLSATSPIQVGDAIKAATRNSPVCQKKARKALNFSSSPSSKKRKVRGVPSDERREKFNDVLAGSGVNLMKEEVSLFSGPREDIHHSQVSDQFVKEEEDRLILEKIPLQRKLEQILGKYSLKSFSNDVERCLSLCIEERMRGLIANVIRLSNQRFNEEKHRHNTEITSTIHQQIMLINQKASEEWEKKQAEAEKFQNLNGTVVSFGPGLEGEKEKDGLLRPVKEDKEGDETMPMKDEMCMKAANFAIQAALGDDDMLSRWQLKVLQSRQKYGRGINAATGFQPRKDMSQKLSSTGSSRANQEADESGHSYAYVTESAAVKKPGRTEAVGSESNMVRSISAKDVTAVLEREFQTSKSTLLYRLYEKLDKDTWTVG